MKRNSRRRRQRRRQNVKVVLSVSTSSLRSDPLDESLKQTSNPLSFQPEVLNLGCLPFAQTTRVEILCKNTKTMKFDVMGE